MLFRARAGAPWRIMVSFVQSGRSCWWQKDMERNGRRSPRFFACRCYLWPVQALGVPYDGCMANDASPLFETVIVEVAFTAKLCNLVPPCSSKHSNIVCQHMLSTHISAHCPRSSPRCSSKSRMLMPLMHQLLWPAPPAHLRWPPQIHFRVPSLGLNYPRPTRYLSRWGARRCCAVRVWFEDAWAVS